MTEKKKFTDYTDSILGFFSEDGPVDSDNGNEPSNTEYKTTETLEIPKNVLLKKLNLNPDKTKFVQYDYKKGILTVKVTK